MYSRYRLVLGSPFGYFESAKLIKLMGIITQAKEKVNMTLYPKIENILYV